MSKTSRTPLTDFIRLLSEEGRALTRDDLHLHAPTKFDLVSIETLMVEIAERAAMQAPGTPPSLDVSSAVWAAQAFAWASGMLIDRSETRVELPERLSISLPGGSTPGEHWSVDLVFRYARDLIDRSAKIGKEDPLHGQLLKLLEPWPLSSVGTEAENQDAKLGVILANDCLRIIYVDRVIGLNDNRRAGQGQLPELIANVIGGHRQLAAGLADDVLEPLRETK